MVCPLKNPQKNAPGKTKRQKQPTPQSPTTPRGQVKKSAPQTYCANGLSPNQTPNTSGRKTRQNLKMCVKWAFLFKNVLWIPQNSQTLVVVTHKNPPQNVSNAEKPLCFPPKKKRGGGVSPKSQKHPNRKKPPAPPT